MTFGRRRNRFFAHDSFSFFVVSGLGSFWSDLRWRSELIRDLPVKRGPVADQMDISGRSQTGGSLRDGSMPVIDAVQLRAFIVQSKSSSKEVIAEQVLGVENARHDFEVRPRPRVVPNCGGICEVSNQEMRKTVGLYLQLFQRIVVDVSGIGVELEFTPTEFFGHIACAKLNAIGQQGAEIRKVS